MQAVILAAGRGTRLQPLTNDKPKCLIDVGNMTIIEHQIGALRRCGIKDILIVTGHYSDKIKETLGKRARYTYNPRFDQTNSLYSLWLIKNKINDDFILLNADVFFHTAILERLINSQYPDVLAVDSKKKLIDGEMNVKINEGIRELY